MAHEMDPTTRSLSRLKTLADKDDLFVTLDALVESSAATVRAHLAAYFRGKGSPTGLTEALRALEAAARRTAELMELELEAPANPIAPDTDPQRSSAWADRPPLREGGPEWEALTAAGPDREPVPVPAAPSVPRLRVPIKMTASVDRADWAAANGLENATMDALAADLYAYLQGQLLGDLPGMLTETDARVVDLKPRRPLSDLARRTPRFNAVLQFTLDLDGVAWASTNGMDPDATAALIKDVRAYVAGELTGTLQGLLGETEGKVRLWET